MDREVRNRLVAVRMSEREYAQLKMLSQLYDLPVSDVLRRLVIMQARREQLRDRDQIPLLDPLGLRKAD